MPAPSDFDPLADYDPGCDPQPEHIDQSAHDVPLPEEPPEWDEYDPGPEPDHQGSYTHPVGPDLIPAQPGPPADELSEQALATRVHVTVRKVLAGLHGRPGAELLGTLQQVRSAGKVLALLPEHDRDALDGLFEVLEFTYAGVDSAVVDLTDLPVAEVYTDQVRAEVTRVSALAAAGGGAPNPATAWFALVEQVQRRATLNGLRKLERAILAKGTAEELVDLFGELEPPTTKRSLTAVHRTLTAVEYMEDLRAERAGMPEKRFSSGYRSLDLAFTATGEPLGFLAPGEQCLFGGRTGTGKSSLVYAMFTSMLQDVVNWGLPDALGMLWHTEEETETKIRAAGLDSGMRFHHLARNAVVKNVGTSRQAMTTSLYDTVINAVHRSQATGRPATDFLPQFGFVDYLQSMIDKGEDKTKATEVTAELILRGFQAFNPEEMAKFSGISFREYAGMPWPDGLEHHRMAVVVMAQLVKQDETAMWYKPNRKDLPLSEFVLMDDNDNPLWDVREGDLRLLRKDAILGSSTVQNNATITIMLHRSRPNNNPAVAGEDGVKHLMDTRARFLLDKTRTGSSWIYVPMHFDIQQDPRRGRAQYFDARAEEAIAAGRFTPDGAFVESGDPILPRRPVVSPLAGVRYA